MREEARGHATQWKEKACGQGKFLPRFGNDAPVSGFQRLSQNPFAFPLGIDVRRIEQGDTGVRRSHNQRKAFTVRVRHQQGAQLRTAQPQHRNFAQVRQLSILHALSRTGKQVIQGRASKLMAPDKLFIPSITRALIRAGPELYGPRKQGHGEL
jgi:hypothetical protein